jgi:hypothetical protein
VYLQATDTDVLKNNLTLSEYGSSSSWSEDVLTMTNCSLPDLASRIEDLAVFPFPVLIEKTRNEYRYDFTLDCTSEESLRASLAEYGLTISAPQKSRLRLLYVNFETEQ